MPDTVRAGRSTGWRTSVGVLVVLRLVQVRPFVHHPGPRVRHSAVLDVGDRSVQPRVQRGRLFHGGQRDFFVFVQYRRHGADDCRGAGAEELEYLENDMAACYIGRRLSAGGSQMEPNTGNDSRPTRK